MRWGQPFMIKLRCEGVGIGVTCNQHDISCIIKRF